ncbi:MAG: hypothetical protein L0I62_04020 [Gammaproteobacteria bacterium]|nr:hypothetical protein [Gammaproteobacteria bacterium]
MRGAAVLPLCGLEAPVTAIFTSSKGEKGMNTSITPGRAAALGASALAGLLLAGCAMGGHPQNQTNEMQSSQMKSDEMPSSGMQKSGMDTTMQMSNRYGGPAYHGEPALGVTVALVMAGGGPGDFSLVTALNSMLGEKTVNAEVTKLTEQYGKKRVGMWVKVMEFYIADTLKIAQAKGIELPAPADLSGTELAAALVKAGTAKDGTFWAGYLFDHAVSHPIHIQLMNDADAEFGAKWDANAHAITNQAFYDVAQALGMKQVKLASYNE